MVALEFVFPVRSRQSIIREKIRLVIKMKGNRYTATFPGGPDRDLLLGLLWSERVLKGRVHPIWWNPILRPDRILNLEGPNRNDWSDTHFFHPVHHT
jgi:hypothetical protein